MKKLTIQEAAEQLGVSKEAIHNRIRRGSMESVQEEGVKYVLMSHAKPHATMQKSPLGLDDRYYRYLEEQNAKLEERITQLEGETRTLREQKEQMLIAEREKIEQIYREKDEQLKAMLHAISTNFMLEPKRELHMPKEESQDAHLEAEIEDESIAAIEDEEPDPARELFAPISLKRYLKERAYSKKQREKAKGIFEKLSKKDKRIILIGAKLYIHPQKYDYSDLLALL